MPLDLLFAASLSQQQQPHDYPAQDRQKRKKTRYSIDDPDDKLYFQSPPPSPQQTALQAAVAKVDWLAHIDQFKTSSPVTIASPSVDQLKTTVDQQLPQSQETKQLLSQTSEDEKDVLEALLGLSSRKQSINTSSESENDRGDYTDTKDIIAQSKNGKGFKCPCCSKFIVTRDGFKKHLRTLQKLGRCKKVGRPSLAN